MIKKDRYTLSGSGRRGATAMVETQNPIEDAEAMLEANDTLTRVGVYRNGRHVRNVYREGSVAQEEKELGFWDQLQLGLRTNEQRIFGEAMARGVQMERVGRAKMAEMFCNVAALYSQLPLNDIRDEVKRRALLADAAEAEERYGVDECERFATRLRLAANMMRQGERDAERQESERAGDRD